MSADVGVNEIGVQGMWDSLHWFPHLHATQEELVQHLTLGLIGEAGEVANVVKKARYDGDFAPDIEALAHELADVLVYTCDIAEALGIDLAQAYREKHQICQGRWGDNGRSTDG